MEYGGVFVFWVVEDFWVRSLGDVGILEFSIREYYVKFEIKSVFVIKIEKYFLC